MKYLLIMIASYLQYFYLYYIIINNIKILERGYKMKRNELSKLMSYILRHHPEEFGLELGDNGYVDLTLFINSISNKYPEVTWADILREVHDFKDKQRFEIKYDKIRALHGHSIKSNIKHIAELPPQFLYHGTSHKAIDAILVEGLKPMNREFLHLADNIKMAETVGRRYDKNPIILVIDTTNIDSEFYNSENGIWLTKHIKPEYIKIM